MIDESDVEFTRKVTWLASNVIQLLESVKTVVTGDEQLSTIVNAYVDGLIVKVENARDAAIRIVTSASSKLTGGIGSSELTLEQLVRTGITNLLNSITALKQTVTQPFEQLVQQYYGQFLTRLNTEMAASLAPVTAALRKIHAGDLFIELVQEATANTLRFVMTNGEATLVASRVPLTDLFVVTNSEVIFNIPLKFELDHFTPLPTLSDIQTWIAQSAFSIQIDETVNMLYSYVDDYYRARAIMLMPRDEMLPPFKGHSFVSGFKHFSTFDKRSYDFSSACATTHILAADHRNGNFTVSLAYADPALENSMNSLEVIVENRRVSISSDYKVRVGDRIKQLPLTVGKMSVSLEGHTVHVRHIEGDVDVACDFTKQLCTVDVSPYYFGATAGLAGTFNNEPMDDFTSPAHQLLTTPGQLATAWEASSTECAQNSAAPSVPECNSATRQAVCEAIFKSKNSVHRGCFPLVDPTPFMEMCMADMCNEEDQTKSCAASAAYGYRCGLLGASFGQPDHCITCTAANGDRFDASSSNVEAEVTGIDVVMVVEEGRCMGRSGISKAFKKIFKKLYAGLSDSRMRNTRYRLVGYGGSGANNEPHSYTIRSKLSTVRKNDLLKSL
uniref:VWFD domain-containing protein n=1 Tax=Ciona savignyi TaxID=51511 RepID=H2Z9S4_CIOSA